MITIPKIIHYCWFGENEKSLSEINCIHTWKEKLPDYSIIEWNETNFDIDTAPQYVKQAYEAKKYAFVSDYVRMKALYQHGGIYFDTDIEVLAPFEECLDGNSLVLGFETDHLLMTAFIACEKGHPFIKQFLSSYENRKFLLDDGSYDLTPNTDLWSPQAAEWGIDLSQNVVQTINGRIKVYPIEIFCGFDVDNWHENVTKNTKTIHHMAFSWADDKTKRKNALIHRIQKTIGIRNYDRIRYLLKK